MSVLRAAALAYAAQGRRVFPVGLAKGPLTAHGFKDATTVEGCVREWWSRWPNAGVGTPTGPDWFVLDVDDPRALHALEAEHGALPPTIHVVTPRPGRHIYLRGGVRNSRGALPDGIDVRGSGGYVLLPPSPHPKGVYEWGTPPNEIEMAVAPEWLLDILAAPRNGNGRASPIGPAIPEGRRNQELTSLAGTMRRRGFDEPEIAAGLLVVNRRRCTPSLPESEVLRIAASVARYDHGYSKPASATAGIGSARRARLTPAGAIRSERVHWLWQERMARRAVTIVAGEKGLGKSTLTNGWLPAQLTRGELPGELIGEPVDVVIASAEDDWRSVVKPRLMAHDADLDRVHRLDMSDREGADILTLPDDVGLVEAAFVDLRERVGRPIGAFVIDPITAFLSPGLDSHKDASVRRALAPVAALADRQGLAVIVVAHLTKDDNQRLLSRVSGSGAFVNAARSVLAFARDPDDPDGDERVLVMAASNWGRLAPSLAWRLGSQPVQTDDSEWSDIGLLELLGDTTVNVGDLQRHADSAGDRDDAREAIVAALGNGPRPALEVKQEVAGRLACSTRTVERAVGRMEKDGELVRGLAGFPATATWKLAGSATTVPTFPDLGECRNCENAATAGDSASGGDSRDSRDTAAVVAPPVTASTCGHPASAQWRLAPGGPWVCGLCHPPVAGLNVQRAGDAT